MLRCVWRDKIDFLTFILPDYGMVVTLIFVSCFGKFEVLSQVFLLAPDLPAAYDRIA